MSGNKETIISYQTAVQLQIILTICALSENEYEVMCNKYLQVFHGLGKLKDREIKFHIDENVLPIAQVQDRYHFMSGIRLQKC